MTFSALPTPCHVSNEMEEQSNESIVVYVVVFGNNNRKIVNF